MRILILGANGFLGSQIVATLRLSGHQLICGVRKQSAIQEQFPQCEIMICDFNHDITADIWIPRLKDIDVVINCIGILQQQHGQSIKAIHELAPIALFQACYNVGIRRVIHISALGVDEHVNSQYAKTKLAAEKNLMSFNMDWVILRPSLIYAEGSYGGTSLMRAMAALPWIIPVVGDGHQFFQPVYIQDLAEIVKRLVEKNEIIKKSLDVVSAEQVSYLTILQLMRRWLNFGKAKILHIPLNLVKYAVKIADKLGIASFNYTSLTMLLYGNTTSSEKYQELINTAGFTPRPFHEMLFAKPSHVQDRWHARLFFLKPLLRLSLALLWLGSGIVALIPPFKPQLNMLQSIAQSQQGAFSLLISTCLLDIFLGGAMLLNWKIRQVSIIQFIVIIIYTLMCTVYFPHLWLEPFAPLLKNIPILIATLIMIAIAEDR